MHGVTGLLESAALLVLAAFVLVTICARAGVPSIVGYIGTGVLLGPAGSGVLAESEALTSIGELGVVLLLFALGLDFSFEKLASLRRHVFGIGAAQVVVRGRGGACGGPVRRTRPASGNRRMDSRARRSRTGAASRAGNRLGVGDRGHSRRTLTGARGLCRRNDHRRRRCAPCRREGNPSLPRSVRGHLLHRHRHADAARHPLIGLADCAGLAGHSLHGQGTGRGASGVMVRRTRAGLLEGGHHSWSWR